MLDPALQSSEVRHSLCPQCGSFSRFFCQGFFQGPSQEILVSKIQDLCLYLSEHLGSPGGSDDKEFACNAGDLGSISGLGRSPGGEHGNPLQYFQCFPGSLAGKESACNARDPSLIPGSGRSTGKGICYLLQYSWASLVAPCLQRGRPGFDPWVGKIPWRREKLSTPVFWPGEFHGLYSPWGRKESDMTKQLSLHF